MHRVTPGVAAAFGPVKEALREVFFLDLLRGLTEGLPTRDNTLLLVGAGTGPGLLPGADQEYLGRGPG